MGKRKTVTKEEIIKAIKKEPLKGKSFVAVDKNGLIVQNKDCPVCAVGAVLRQADFSNSQIHSFGYDLVENGPCSGDFMPGETVEEHLQGKRFLHALSVQFEHQFKKTGGGKRTREKMVKFVKENFPVRIKLDPAL